MPYRMAKVHQGIQVAKATHQGTPMASDHQEIQVAKAIHQGI